jgi:RimJ/RimL family protein N-acetyltransferase
MTTREPYAKIPGTDLPMLELFPMRAEHIDLVASWISDEKARCWLDLGGGRQELPKRNLYLKLTDTRNCTRLFRMPGTQTLLGLVCLNDVTNEMGSADVWGVRGAYASGPANISVAAFLMMLATGFLDLDRHVIASWIVEGNEFSIAMHRRLGLVETGRQRNRHRMNGRQYDRLLFDITRDEFAARFPRVPSESGRTFEREAPTLLARGLEHV